MRNETTPDFGRRQVTKHFRGKMAFDRELEVLCAMQGTRLVPELLEYGERTISTSLLEGSPLSCLLGTMGTPELKAAAEGTISWLDEFSRVSAQRLGGEIVLDDLNFKNLLWDGRSASVTGVDFELWHRGNSAENFFALIAMFDSVRLSPDADTAAIRDMLCRIVISLLGCTPGQLEEQTAKKRELISLRRSAMPLVRKAACVIMAGGRSSRMGFPKGLLMYGRYRFVDYLLDAAWMFDSVLISANQEEYRRFGCELIADLRPGIGPMAALYTALLRTGSEWVFLLPCDMIFIRPESIFGLFAAADPLCDACVLCADGRLCPTVGLYNRRLLPRIEELIAQENYRMRDILSGKNVRLFKCDDAKQFKNINTAQQYRELL